MKTLAYVVAFASLLATAAMAAFCFSAGREIAGAINVALAVVNAITLCKL